MTIHCKKAFINLILIFTILSILTSCNLPTRQQSNPPIDTLTQSKSVQVTVTFQVKIPQPLPSGDSIYLSLLDEVTGIAFNAQKYKLTIVDPTTYKTSLTLNAGRVIKYRYNREGSVSSNEYTSIGSPVRYRLYRVEGQATLIDTISSWMDSEYSREEGKITGFVHNASNNEPIPSILVISEGVQTLTHADGSFILEGLSTGTHNLVFYALDGSYQIFQQGATVAKNSTTPVYVKLKPANLVTVIFNVKVPADTPQDAPLRIAGNILQLGNTFSDLSGGMSTISSRMPVLGKLDDGSYLVTLKLPAGTYLEYKYTLGDGLWSSELTKDGSFQLRRFVIPALEIKQNDTVETWHKRNNKIIQFEAISKKPFPQNEGISLQLNPGFGWMEPLPMWRSFNQAGNEIWKFDLTGPYTDIPTLQYRYCRQGQCGIADDLATVGENPVGRIIYPDKNPGLIRDEILDWAWYANPNMAANVPDVQPVSKGLDFVAGVSLTPKYHSSWAPLFPQVIDDISNLSVNWFIIDPTWSFSDTDPLLLSPSLSQDVLWSDLQSTIGYAQQHKLNIGIFPQVNIPQQVIPSTVNKSSLGPGFLPLQAGLWWQNSARDYSWWTSFFDSYRNFILHHATLAAQTNASTLILGGEWIEPALPEGKLLDGSSSNVPQDAELRWRELINQVRKRYSGTITWALPYPYGVRNPPPFLDAVDQVYILWSGNLGNAPNTPLAELQQMANSWFDDEIVPFQQKLDKPVVIAISSPSIDAGTHGCIPANNICLGYDEVIPPGLDMYNRTVNIQDQANAYNAILDAIYNHPSISGFISMGYYPPASLLDKSTSIHGKPASSVVWYWSNKFFGK